ncbi:MAG TPA: DUF5701 family protein [Kiritimatiellia bacterium]|nr:DUF5701 family protein [Kiritimatiellia bacterium]HMP34151.1 DUF5701 family protein [Kiritimatiellia bacterium]
MTTTLRTLELEYDRQIAHLESIGLTGTTSLPIHSFRRQARALKRRLGDLVVRARPDRLPFVVVVKQQAVPMEDAMATVTIRGASGIVNMDPVVPTDFHPINRMAIPPGDLYLLEQVESGRDTLDIRPEDALRMIRARRRSPLTIDEGVALVVQFPHILTDKRYFNCFQLPGSRRADQRIPSIWISYGRPRLGWCWNRNKHSWLGCASCRRRLGTDS